jgi:hypothetical protein
MKPRSGDVLHITRDASVQFTEPFLFRVIRLHDWTTYDGWCWLDGYELNAAGDAVERRSLFVQTGGLRQVNTGPDVRSRSARRLNAAPVAPAPPLLRRNSAGSGHPVSRAG